MPSTRHVASTLALCGLLMAALLVASFAWLFTRQAAALHEQADAAERTRLDAVQLLRIQTDLNKIGNVMRDIAADPDSPVTASASQLDDTRRELTDALTKHAALSAGSGDEGYLTTPVTHLWTGVDRMLALARGGHEEEARTELRLSLQRQHAGLMTTIAYLLLENNEQHESASRQTRLTMAGLERQATWLLGGALASLVVAGVAMARAGATGRTSEPATADGDRS